MNKFVKSLINTISLVAFFFSMSIESAQAATRLTPAHLYNWARTGNTARLEQFQKYINLHDHNKNTALCLAQRAKDRKSYSLLLDYGASTDVECHDDDDKVCAIIAGEKTKVHPAAFVLLGLGAAAGAYVLLDDDDDDYKCLPQNNEFSSRSDCEANNIGYTCEKNNNGCYTRGVASQCPAGYSTAYQSVADCGQYPEGWIYEQNDYSGELNCGKCTAKTCSIGETECAEASTGFVSAHTTNGTYAGDTACLTCNYECDTTNGYYDSDTQCQDGGYICSTVTQNGKSCYIRTGSEQCPTTHPSETPCETETEAFTNGEQSIQVGFRTCYSCNYQCNTSNGWQDGYCQAGRVCDDIDSPVTCHKDNGCPEGFTYTDADVEQYSSYGWIFTPSATGSGCWKREVAPCPDGYQIDLTVGQCGSTGGRGYTIEENGYSGGFICTKCTPRECDEGSTEITSTTNCSAGHPEGYEIENVDYYGEVSCNKCRALTCEEQGDYVSDHDNDCPSAPEGIFAAGDDSDNVFSGESPCYKCVYICNNPSWKPTCPDGNTCSQSSTAPDNSLTCYKPDGCDESKGYYDDPSECETSNTGYNCTQTTLNGVQCYIRGEQLDCPTTYPSDTPCQKGTGYNTVENELPWGSKTCYKCEYSCDTSSGYYNDSSECPTTGANGWYLTNQVNVDSLTCGTCAAYQCATGNSTDYTDIIKCPTANYIHADDVNTGSNVAGGTASGNDICNKCTYICDYDSIEDCEEKTGNSCTQTSITIPDNSGNAISCPIPQPNTCPSTHPNSYTDKTACEDANGHTCTPHPRNSTCFFIETTCPTGYDYTSEEACAKDTNTICEQHQAGTSCWKPTTNTFDCTTLGYSETECTNGTYYTSTSTSINDATTEFKTCYQCIYTCSNGTTEGLTDCSNQTHPEGWTYAGEQTPDGTSCGKCTAYQQCVTGSTDYQDADDCPATRELTPTDVNPGSNGNGGSYIGDLQCGICGYQCHNGEGPTWANTTEGKKQCEDGGYVCSTQTFTPQTKDSQAVTCYVRTGSASCPDTHPSDTQCTTSTEYNTTQTETPQGDNTCYSCTYSCKNEGNYVSTCPAGKECTPISLPDGQTCYKDPTCPSGYTSQTQEECQATGWICSESATGSGCWKIDGAAPCSQGVLECLAAEDNSDDNVWDATFTPIDGVYSGGRECGTCTYACNTGNDWYESCPTNYTCEYQGSAITCYRPSGCNPSGAYPTENACSAPTGTTLIYDDAISSETQTCYTCTYGCDATQGYYDNRTDCINGGYTCSEEATELATNTDGTSVKCYKREGIFQCSTSGTEYTSDTECEVHNASAVALNQTSTTINGKTCYKCEYQCNPGYLENKTCESVNADSRLEVISDNSYGKDGVILCHLCQYACSEEGSYADDPTCQSESGNSCTQTPITTPDGSGNTVSCYIPNPGTCPTGYTSYTDQTTCESATGYNCIAHTSNATCFITGDNCPAVEYIWTDKSACEESTGVKCEAHSNNSKCYRPNPTGYCPDDYPYITQQSCETTNNVVCKQHQAGTSCWQPTTNTFDCTTLGYSEEPCTDDTYYTATSTPKYDATTHYKTCYQCTYTCSNSSTEGLTDCSSKSHPEGWTYYSEETPDGKTCGICQVKSTCSNGGQIEDCGQFGDGESILSYGLFDLSEVNIDSYRGDTQCHTCEPICNTGRSFSNSSDCESYGNGAQCISVNSAGVYNGYSTSVTCWYQNGCKTGYTEGLTEEVCADNYETYIYESANFHNGQTNTSHVCGKCTESKCPATYNGQTVVTSVDQCGTTGADGWTFTEIEADEGLTCGYCTAKECTSGTTEECSAFGDGDSINIYRLFKMSETSIAGVYSGDTQCHTCNPSCRTGISYTSKDDCETDTEATCTSESSDDLGEQYGFSYSTNVTCWYPSSCKSPYDSSITEESCSASETFESYIYYDTLNQVNTECGRCVAGSCNTANGEYDTQEACQTANSGFTCTQSGTCYKISGCKEYTTFIAKNQTLGNGSTPNPVNACGSTGDNGWNVTYTEDSTNTYYCLTCTAKQCQAGSTTGLSMSDCPEYNYITANSRNSSANGAYSGQTECYDCSYYCDEEKGAHTDAMLCLNDNSSCTPQTINLASGDITCYVGDDYLLSALSDEIAISNTDKIELTSTGTEDIYGIQTAENTANTTSLLNGEVGSINITHNSTGSAYGMYGTSDNTLMNTTGASINIQNNSTGSATGMYVSTGGKAYNSGDINITGTTGTAIGIYGEGQNTIENSGTINVSGTDAYGIYVKDGTDTTVTNTETGTITVNATNNAHGIYIDTNSTNAVVENKGIITVNGEVKDGSTGITLNGASLKNYSLVRFSDITDLNALGGKVYLEDGGVYEAKSLEGDLNIGTSNVTGENKDTYIKENSIVAETTDNLNLVSESALFTAEKQKNEQGDGYNVVMNRKDFGEFTPNASIKSYLESNYKDGEMVEMFDSIKSQNSGQGASEAIAGELGYDVMPNFADENFIVMKSLNRNIADTILKPTDEANRVVAGYDNISLETENKALLSGADLSANSMYTFGDKRLDNKNRLGLGLSFTELSSSYEKGGDRDVSIISIFMPYLHKFSDKLRLASVLSVGYGTGEYERGGNNESDISDIFYGFTNELRYTIDLNGYAELEPALMLNAIGYTEDGFDEGDGENALETKKTHNLSVEAGIGLFLKKEVQTNEHGKIGFRVGGAYYRELATPYDKIDARLKRGNASWYRINDYANLYDHDRAILEAAVDYEYKSIGLYAKYNRLIQKNNPELFDLGIKYKF